MHLKGKVLNFLPCEVRVLTSEVTVGSTLAHNRALKVKIPDDTSWTKIEVVLNNFSKLSIGLSVGNSSVRVNKDGKWVWNSNGVRKLYKCPSAKSSGNKTLGDPTGSISGGTINLCGVLSREGSSSVGTPSSVGVNDNLTSSKTGISVGSSNNETTRGVKMVNGLVIEVVSGDNGFDDMLHEISRNFFVGDFLTVLGGDNNGVNSLWNWDSVNKLVLASNLSLSVGTDPVANSVLTDLGKLGSQTGGKLVGKRHETFGFISGVSKHNSLVTGSNILNFHGVYGLGNIGRLLLNGNNNITGLVVKTFSGIVVSNVLNCVTDNLFVVYGSSSGDFSKDHYHTSFTASFASNTTGFVSSNTCVKNGIGNLVTELIGVTLVYRFG